MYYAEKSFLGTGWSFPPEFDERTGLLKLSSDEEDIRESLFILLSTTPGERIMDVEFGCDIHGQVFKQIDGSSLAEIRDLIATAILHHEPRITLEEIDFTMPDYSSGLLMINIEYTIRKVNVRTNIVYPFYILEGTDIGERDI